jgi:hypothetical protein
MVVHETYKGPNGWVTPAEVRVEESDGNRRASLIADGTPIEIGAIEKMSKSKKNTVDPTDIIESYGADTARWFMLSDSPPERDVIWTEAGVEGAHRFVQRIWRLVSDAAPHLAGIKAGKAKELRLGNLESRRDWGFAGDYVEAMWRMLQHDKPDSFVVGTGQTHSVREFCEAAFAHAGLDYRDFVVQDSRFYRPAEVDLLISDPARARAELGWEQKVSFEQLVAMMVEADMAGAGRP